MLWMCLFEVGRVVGKKSVCTLWPNLSPAKRAVSTSLNLTSTSKTRANRLYNSLHIIPTPTSHAFQPHTMVDRRSFIVCMRLLLAFYTTLAVTNAAAAQEPLIDKREGYKVGDKIPVSCLNRTTHVLSHTSNDPIV